MNVLVTGGAGYIGSHAVLHLMRAGHAVTILDNLSRGNIEAVDRLRELGSLTFIKGDCLSQQLLRTIFEERHIDAVMHFAALAYVGESVQQPMRYWLNNTAGAIALLHEAARANVSRFIFSSTCATYGELFRTRGFLVMIRRAPGRAHPHHGGVPPAAGQPLRPIEAGRRAGDPRPRRVRPGGRTGLRGRHPPLLQRGRVRRDGPPR